MINVKKVVNSTIIVTFIGLGILFLFISNSHKELKGEFNILVSSESYNYINEMAVEFMMKNDKVKIGVEIGYRDNYIGKVKEALNKDINLVQVDTIELYILMQLEDRFKESPELIEAYKNNFTDARLNEINFKNEIKGIPLTSRPLVLYIRQDLLEEYGYDKSSVNTWQDAIALGEDLYAKSNMEIKLINATGQDMMDLVSLLVMQEIESGEEDVDTIIVEVKKMVELLKGKNIINTKDGGGFASRISSVNGMRELSALNEECVWVAMYPPSKELGGNKFYVGEGSNLVIVNRDDSINRIADEFLEYLTANTEKVIKYAKNGEFFPSYLYTYKDKGIEENIKNFSGRSPLVVMDNIVKKAPHIKDYQLYRDVKLKIIDNY